MKTTEFCFWLQGLFELADPVELSAKQTDLIRRHLALVFKHEIDPSYSDDPDVQAELNAIHEGETTTDYDPLSVSPPFPPHHPYPNGGHGGGTVFRC